MTIILLCIIGFLICGVFLLYREHRSRLLRLNEELLRKTADLEEQVMQSRAAVQVKSDFLSKMSHEIRTPLNAIMGMTQIIRNTTEQATINDCIEKMESSSQHLLGIINDILDLSKMESGKLFLDKGLFSLTHEIEFVVSMFKEMAAEKGLTLSCEASDIRHDGIITDKLRLNQTLINLLSNAVKFTDSGGAVELIAKEIFHMDGESVYQFTVRDTGIGIEPEQAKKLFTPFSQAHSGVTRMYGGTGLGLAISQSLVQMMGGDIELETEYGKGSVFRFTIRVPAKEKAKVPPRETLPDTPLTDFSRKRILVVDDNAVNLSVARGMLKLHGIQPETADSGRQAIELIKQTKFDLVFMDYLMPDMDGLETTKAIRELEIDVPIIALTACAVEGQKEMLLEAGMNDYLPKPIINAELLQILRRWIPGESLSDPSPKITFTNKEEPRKTWWDNLEKIAGLDLSAGLRSVNGKRDA